MILEVRSVPPFYKNGFVVGCSRTREAVVIDPGDETAQLVSAAREQRVAVRHILLTHAHIDHITGVALAKMAFKAPVFLHRADAPLYDHAVEQGRMFGLDIVQPPPVDAFYDQSPIRFGDYEVRVHHTPGHCPGGVCLQIDDVQARRHLFVGDTLFAGSIGRTDLPGADAETLMRSIVDVLLPLGDASVVHPGHGPDTTIARERTTNPFVMEYVRQRRL